MNKEVFIFCIAYNCGKVLNKCLDSFHEHHNEKIHIFGNASDFKDVKKHKNNEYIEMSSDDALREHYKKGHSGTAYIWAKVINKEYGEYKKIIQIDSDVVFRSNCVSDILTKFDDGYDLVGPRRAYKNMKKIPPHMKEEDIRKLEDVVSTFFVGVNLEKIGNYDFDTLHKMVSGFNPLGHPIIDFFDPISFDILNNGGRIFYLDFMDYGSCDENGCFDNVDPKMNELYDFGNKIIHFAGIGSGQNFINNGSENVPDTYVSWAKERYALYIKLFYNEDVGVNFDKKNYEFTKKTLSKIELI